MKCTHQLKEGSHSRILFPNESWKYEWADFVPTALTDANFNTAIALWFSDEAAAIETYKYISDWDVSAVTNMRQAFRNKAEFNEDISNWDTSSVTTMEKCSTALRLLISPSVIGTPLP